MTPGEIAKTTIRVSRTANGLIQDVEIAAALLALVPHEDPERVKAQYAALNHRRRDLYEYIAQLEQQIPSTERAVVRRF